MASSDKLIREWAVLDCLSIALKEITDTLEFADDISVDVELLVKDKFQSAPVKTAAIAIRKTKRLVYDTLWKASIFATHVSDAKLRLAVLTDLGTCHDALRQADVPASMALHDGYEQEAIVICEDAMIRGWERCGRELCRHSPACRVRASELNLSFTMDDYQTAVGTTRSEFLKITAQDLDSLVSGWNEAANIYKPHSVRDDTARESDLMMARQIFGTAKRMKQTTFLAECKRLGFKASSERLNAARNAIEDERRKK